MFQPKQRPPSDNSILNFTACYIVYALIFNGQPFMKVSQFRETYLNYAEHNAVNFHESKATVPRNTPSPFSGWKGKPGRKPE
jgi:hypothetical protein